MAMRFTDRGEAIDAISASLIHHKTVCKGECKTKDHWDWIAYCIREIALYVGVKATTERFKDIRV